MSILTTEIDSAIATVTLNRPDSLNALNCELAKGLHQSLRAIAGREDIRCVVLKGTGGHFMAGGDIAWFDETLKRGGNFDEQIKPLFDDVHGIILTLRSMPQPVVAAVQGACAGFGISLMCACDLAIAAQGSVFTLAYCHLGVSPDGGSTWALPRMIGMKRASELLLLGDRFDAASAEKMGLINQSVALDKFDAAIDALSSRLAAGPARAYARGKSLLQQSLQTPLENQLQEEMENFLRCTREPAFAEGVRAFVEKRKPDFNGN